MCTYATYQCDIAGSGKAADGWFALTCATVYVDHPVHALEEHTLNIDFAAPQRGPAARVAVELHADAAYDLVMVLAEALLDAPADITGLDPEQRNRLAQLGPNVLTPRTR